MVFLKRFLIVQLVVIAMTISAHAQQTLLEANQQLLATMSEVSAKYTNAQNIAKYMEGVDRPLEALAVLSGSSNGNYKREIMENYLAHDQATATNKLNSSRLFNSYFNRDLTQQFSDFYGLYNSNGGNDGEPITADIVLETVDAYLPEFLESEPALKSSIAQIHNQSHAEMNFADGAIRDLALTTGMTEETVKVVLTAMTTGYVAPYTVVETVTEAEAQAQAFIQANFADELAEAQAIQDKADGYMAEYEAAIQDYNLFIENMESDAFAQSFENYAQYFGPEEKERAFQPYVDQAHQKLNLAKNRYQLALQELSQLKDYLDKLQSQKIAPALEEYNKLFEGAYLNDRLQKQVLSKISASGIFAFSVSSIVEGATSSATSAVTGAISNSDATKAVSSLISSPTTTVNSAVSSAAGAFSVQVPDFGSVGAGVASNIGGQIVGGTTSTLTNAINTTNSLNVGSLANLDVTGTLTSVFSGALGGGAANSFLLPTGALTRAWDPLDAVRGESYKLLCDDSEKGKTGSAGRLTRYSPSECNDRIHRISPFATKASDYVGLVAPEGGLTRRQDNSSQISLKYTDSSNDALGDLLEEASKKTATFITNRKGDKIVLTKGQVNGKAAAQKVGLKAAGYDLDSATTRSTTVVTKSGQEVYENFNPAFSATAPDREAVEQGYCLMIEDRDGDYQISLNESYNPTYDPFSDSREERKTAREHIKYNLDSGKRASVVRITDPSHPFSPRHKDEWIDAADPLSVVCGGVTSSPSAGGFGISGLTSDGFGNAINSAGNIVSGVDALQNGGIGGALGGLTSLGQGLGGAAAGIAGGLGEAAGAVGGAIGTVANTAQGVVDGVTGSVNTVVSGVVETAQGVAGDARTGVLNAAGEVVGNVRESATGQAVEGAFTSAQTTVTGVVDSAKGTVSSVSTKVTERAKGVVTSAKDSIGAEVKSNGQIVKAGKVLGSVATNAKEAVGGVVDSSGRIVKSTGEVVGSVVGGVTGTANEIIGGVVSRTGEITNSAGEVVGKVAGDLTGGAGSLVGGTVTAAGEILNGAGKVVGSVVGSVGGVVATVAGLPSALTQAAKDRAFQVATQAATTALAQTAGSQVAGAVANIRSITKTCGTDRKRWLGGAYAWQKVLKAGGKDYREYDKPIKDNGGKILTTAERLARYTTIGTAAFSKCMASSFGLAKGLCCDIAEHSACQIAILPHVTMANKLPLSYTIAHAQDSSDRKLPHIRVNAHDSTQTGGFDSNGYDWKTSLPADKFGFNMPSVKSSVTGDVGFGEIDRMSKKNYAQYMLTIAGVNSNYSMSEDNNSDPLVKNMSCGTGGWEELKRYQENCARFAGVNCICDYQKAMFKGTSWAYVMDRVSATSYPISARSTEQTFKTRIGDEEHLRTQNITPTVTWKRKALASIDGTPFHAQANYPLGGENNGTYPSAGSKKSLTNARAGNVIVMQEAVGNELTDPASVKGVFKRPWMAAFVESINPNTRCLKVTTKNAHSIFLDACGNSENLGHETQFEICPPESASASAFSARDGMPDCASDHEHYQCQETAAGWNSWTVHDFYADRNTSFDDATGEVQEVAQCEQYQNAIKFYIDKEAGDQTGQEDYSQSINSYIDAARAAGCPPNPEWGVKPGHRPARLKSDQTQANYVPASPTESGVPLNFDFLGGFGSLLNKLTGGGDIFPKVAEGAEKLGGDAIQNVINRGN